MDQKISKKILDSVIIQVQDEKNPQHKP